MCATTTQIVAFLYLYAVVSVIGDEPSKYSRKSFAFTEHPQDVVALKGDSVFFSCKVAGPPIGSSFTNRSIFINAPAEITWLHNGSIVQADDPAFEISTTAGGRRGHLSFKLREENFEAQLGDYQCVNPVDFGKVEEGNGKLFVTSMTATLTVAQLEDFSPERSKTIEAFENNDVVIDCKLPLSTPEAFVEFFKDDVRLNIPDAETTSLEPSERRENMEILNGDTLLIYNISRENAGDYRCSATNHILGETKYAKGTTTLRVEQPEGVEKSRLTFRPEERYQVIVGESLTVPCVASGNPKPEIIWSRMGNNERIDSEHGCLRITNAKETDSGQYMCAIFNGSRRFLRRTTIIVLSPPVFTKIPKIDKESEKTGNAIVTTGTLSEGNPVYLHCQASGTPVPTVKWYFNGLPIVQGYKVLYPNGTLHIPFVRRSSDQGIYQCFATNSVGRNVSALILRIHADESISDEEIELWHEPDLLDHLATVPPSKPNVTQTGRNSALVKWHIRPEKASLDGEIMPIQFFKIQFREFRRGKRSEWRTLDEDINSRSRSFEIMSLKEGVKYRFRVVAVYANNQDLQGPLSKRFRLSKSSPSSSTAPRSAPTLTEVLPLSPTSLRVGWRMRDVLHVEGYFVFIREVSANSRRIKFDKVTIIGRASHSYIFEDLKPGALYEVRAEAFNFAGSSPSSRPVKKRTERKKSSALMESERMPKNDTNTGAVKSRDRENPTPASNSEIVIYLVVGAAVICLMMTLVAFCSIRSCVEKRKAQKAFQSGKEIRDKYSDTSKSISVSHLQQGVSNLQLLRAPSMKASSGYFGSDEVNYNNNVSSTGGSSNAVHETSFSSPHRLSQMIKEQPEAVNRHPNADSNSDVSFERTSLGYEEYTDEPSRTSWKRRRRSEDIV